MYFVFFYFCIKYNCILLENMFLNFNNVFSINNLDIIIVNVWLDSDNVNKMLFYYRFLYFRMCIKILIINYMF